MRILFLHNNFPGQYRRIVKRLYKNKSYQLLSGSLADNKQPAPIRRIGYQLHREPRGDIHPALQYTEKSLLEGQAVMKAFLPIASRGWKPDIMLGHCGWGPTLFLKDIWPDAKFLAYFEWYYRRTSGDVGFLDPPVTDPNEMMRIRMKNTPMLHDLAVMDWSQCPTDFQASQFPAVFRERMTIIHDGVDTDFFRPDPAKTLAIGDRTFKKGDPLVTYIARGMEPYRGFPQFMDAVARLQKRDKTVHVLVIGTDRVAYGKKRRDGKTWRQAALEANALDLSRVHFVGHQQLPFLRDALQVSAVHVYLTVPFVLSWSMLEAMSAGALVVASATPPVEEVIEDGRNGLLVDFFDSAALTDRLAEVLARPDDWEAIRKKARRTILDRYEVTAATDRYLRLIHAVAAGEDPRGI